MNQKREGPDKQAARSIRYYGGAVLAFGPLSGCKAADRLWIIAKTLEDHGRS
jgi:hypothetical protein